ncbi:hypothetical protein PNEG_02441 [Pneumocystis murina B123]|uniref:Uncharacterized protein n=1 Tax=Pneumocystis murina (strain B123) TaxID=1069680 RepID=M7P5D6_PNEMU|nr:hypothetical protein PNEG_02441 [Pneumocystis murina B123]EMR09095.1 hypothetical protein PNEG_02441 [Pneumocystis murina B123]
MSHKVLFVIPVLMFLKSHSALPLEKPLFFVVSLLISTFFKEILIYMNDDRLNLPLISRLILYTSVSSFLSFTLGSIVGGKKSGLRFLVENAHRLPQTVQGWYFYHKTKNYYVMLGGIKVGLKYAFRTSLWVNIYLGMEYILDYVRKCIDAGNTVLASVLSGLIFSYVHQFSYTMTLRIFYLTSSLGLINGVLQDILRYRNGQYVWYLQTRR